MPCELIRCTPPAAAPLIEEEPPMTDTASAPDPEAQNETPPNQTAPAGPAAPEPASVEAPPETRSMTASLSAERRAPTAEAPPIIPTEAQMREIAETAMREERARIAGIQEAGRKLGVAAEVVSDLVTRGVALPEARAALIDAAAARDVATDTRPHVRMSGQDEVETQLTGVVDMAKAASQAWTVGAKVYWDNTAKVATITATGNVLIGAAMLAVGNTAGETIGRVRLNGSVA